MLNGDFSHLSYTEAQLKKILQENEITLKESNQGNKVNLGSIFKDVDNDQELHANDSTSVRNDKKLSGNEITLFLTRVKDFVGEMGLNKLTEIFNKEEATKKEEEAQFKGQFERLTFTKADIVKILHAGGIYEADDLFDRIQKREGTRFESDNNAKTMSKEEVADFLLMLEQRVSKKDYTKIADVIRDMSQALKKPEQVEEESEVGALVYPPKKGKLSNAAKLALQEFEMPISQVQAGKFDTVKIKYEDGKKIAVLSSTKHPFVFELEPNITHNPKFIEELPNGPESVIRYNKGVMEVANVNIRKIDIKYSADGEQTLIFKNSNLPNVVNSSGQRTHFENLRPNDKKTQCDSSNFCLETTVPCDYKVEYWRREEQEKLMAKYTYDKESYNSGMRYLGMDTETKKTTHSKLLTENVVVGKTVSYHEASRFYNLAPGKYAEYGTQKKYAESKGEGRAKEHDRYPTQRVEGVPPYLYYTANPYTGERKRYMYTTSKTPKENEFTVNENGYIFGDGTKIEGLISVTEEKDRLNHYTQVVTNDPKVSLAFSNNPAYAVDVDTKAFMKNQEKKKMIAGKEPYGGIYRNQIKNVKNGKTEYSLVVASESGTQPDGLEFLTKTCQLNKQKVQDMINAGFTKISVEKHGTKMFNITFINPTEKCSLTTSLGNATKYFDRMIIGYENGKLNLDGFKGVFDFENKETLENLELHNVQLAINIPENAQAGDYTLKSDTRRYYQEITINNPTAYGSSDGDASSQANVIVKKVGFTPRQAEFNNEGSYTFGAGSGTKPKFDPYGF